MCALILLLPAVAACLCPLAMLHVLAAGIFVWAAVPLLAARLVASSLASAAVAVVLVATLLLVLGVVYLAQEVP
jgi:hypothetical protein